MDEEMDLKKQATNIKGKNEALHWVRESYRRAQWKKWLKNKRRAVAETGREPYDEERCKRAKAWGCTEVQKVILTGGLITPAATREAGKQEWPHHCPWCKEVPGYHDHMFWECKKRTKQVRKPTDKLQRRLGWPTKEGTKKDNLEILDWMGVVAKKIWEERYGADTGIGRKSGEVVEWGESSDDPERILAKAKT